MLSSVMRYFQKLALVFWLGEMLFFIVIFAPRVFKVLPRDLAGQLQANIFPAYYEAGIVCAVVLIVCRIAGVRSVQQVSFSASTASAALTARRKSRWSLALILAAAGVFVYSALSLTPQIAALQPALLDANVDPSIKAHFDTLHKLSVNVNAFALLCLLALLGLI